MSFLGCESWQLRYQRNNKQSGLKNIRCFPACSTPHRLRGFCGNSITFQYPRQMNFTISFGEFALKESKTMQVNQMISRQDIVQHERVDDLFKPWHRGEVQDDHRIIVFNRQKKGWHYSWVSNKHTSDSEHVFRVYFFEAAGKDKFKCIAIFDSPAFTIFCRRRDKAGVDRLPPQFMSSVSAKSSSLSGSSEDDEEEDEEGEEGQISSGRGKGIRSPLTLTQVKRPKMTDISTLNPLMLPSGFSSSGAGAAPSAGVTNPGLAVPSLATLNHQGAATKSALAQEYADIFRLLAALTNVHDRQQQTTQSVDATSAAQGSSSSSFVSAIGVTANTTLPAPSPPALATTTIAPVLSMTNTNKPAVTNPTTPSTIVESDDPDADLFDITKVISDCWDWISPDGLSDTQFFDTFFAQPSAKPVEEMLLRLGQHLIKEDFIREIEEVFANKASSAGEESKRQVLRCLRTKFESFFQKEGTTLSKFDRDLSLQNPQLTEEKSRPFHLIFPTTTNHLAFHNPMPMENLFRPPFRIVPNGPLDFTGHWRRPASTLETLEKLRSIIGFSWLERKLLLQMEQEFFIWYEGNTMFVRGQRKLAGSNMLIHVIDGVDYPFAQPSAMAGDHSTLAIGLFSRTWATEDGMMHFCTTYTLEYRTIRRTRRSPCGNKLQSTITLQRNESGQLPGIWVDIISFPVLAERITSY